MLALKLGQSLTSNNSATINADTYSLQFTGTEYMSADAFAADINLPKGSVSVWTKVSTMTASGFLCRSQVDSNNIIQLFYHASSNEMRFLYKAGGNSKTVVFTDAIENDGLWHHIFATWDTDADELKIYLDGTLKATNSATLGTFASQPTVFDIGQNTQGASFYKGFLDEFSFFSEVVDINVVRSRSTPINLTGAANLIGYWRFNEGTGSVAADSSGNENTGTLFNSPTWTTDTP